VDEVQPWSLAHAHYVRAGIAACERGPGEAVRELTLAADAYAAADMPLRARIMRYRLGEIEDDTQTRALRDEAEQWIKDQGIVAPARWVGMYAPGLSPLTRESTETGL
jgi:hypothetical protein